VLLSPVLVAILETSGADGARERDLDRANARQREYLNRVGIDVVELADALLGELPRSDEKFVILIAAKEDVQRHPERPGVLGTDVLGQLPDRCQTVSDLKPP
jgi:hypothetical protein